MIDIPEGINILIHHCPYHYMILENYQFLNMHLRVDLITLNLHGIIWKIFIFIYNELNYLIDYKNLKLVNIKTVYNFYK